MKATNELGRSPDLTSSNVRDPQALGQVRLLQLESPDLDGPDRPEPLAPGDAIKNYVRSGSLRYSLGFHSSVRQNPIDSTGTVDWYALRENGDENFWMSSCEHFESVDPLDLRQISSEWPISGGPTMVFAGDYLLPFQVQGCVLVGGQMTNEAGPKTTANANLSVSSSNSVVFGQSGAGTEQFLFVAGPMKPLEDSAFPSAPRILGTVRILITNVSDGNASLAGITIDPFEDGVHYIPIERGLREMYPGVPFNGKRIGFRLVHQCSGTSPGPALDPRNARVLGAASGFSVLTMKPK